MIYGITKMVLGKQPFIEISEERFLRVRQAKSNLVAMIDVEDNLAMLLENYLEYEQDLLELTLHRVIYRDMSWESFRGDFRRIERRLLNLLSTSRRYISQVKHNLALIDEEYQKAVEAYLASEHESVLGYRVMDALRNYMQHRGLGVRALSYPGEWIEEEIAAGLRFRIAPSLRVAELESDEKFKREVLNDLRALGEKIDLTPLVRAYVQSLGEVHEKIREMLSIQVTEWTKSIRELIQEAEEVFEGGLAGLVIVAREDGQIRESEDMFSQFIDYYESLIGKNRGFGRLSARYVSGYSPVHDA